MPPWSCGFGYPGETLRDIAESDFVWALVLADTAVAADESTTRIRVVPSPCLIFLIIIMMLPSHAFTSADGRLRLLTTGIDN